jgi:hypothetical protein
MGMHPLDQPLGDITFIRHKDIGNWLTSDSLLLSLKLLKQNIT